MRLHIFDPQLNRVDGHYAAYNSAVMQAMQRRAVGTTLYGSAQTAASVPLEVKPIFHRGIFDEVASDSLTWALENFAELGREFADDLSTLSSNDFQAEDVAFFPSINQYQIDGVRQWVLRLAPARRPTVVLKASLLTHEMPYLKGRPNVGLIPLLYRFATQQLCKRHRRSRVCAETEEMVRQFSLITGLPVELVPLPLTANIPAPEPHGSRALRIAYLGHASALKGFHVLPDAINRIVAGNDPVEFLVQCYGHDKLIAEFELACSTVPGKFLSIVRGAVADAQYRELLSRSDVILLPYARELYSWASSGIFAEAMSGAKVVIATQGTWPAAQLARFNGGGVIVSAASGEAIASAVRDVTRQFPVLQQRAMKAAPAWNAHHSPDAFASKLLAMADSASKLQA